MHSKLAPPSVISARLIKTLQEKPEKYYEELCKLKNDYTEEYVKKIVNCVQYDTYMGNHLHTLIYVVGDLVFEESKKKNIFGTKIKIDEDTGIEILEKLVEYGVDLYNKNYYEETPLQNLSSKGLTKRKNNEKFKRKLQQYYIDDLNNELPLKSKNTKLIG